MSSKKVSIIVPVYNGEEYINRCVDSLINQTYSNIEIIIINDGSIDNTKNALKKYQDKNNVIIINKNNTGVSDSRNRGIEIASGEFILFVDGDDWIDKKAVDIAVNKIKNNDALRFSHYIVKDCIETKKSNIDDVYSLVNLKISADDMLGNLITNRTEGHLWNYLLRSSIIKKNKILFDKSLFYQEDVLFLIEYFLQCKDIVVISDALYFYYINNNSATQKKGNIVKNISSLGLLRTKILDVLKNNKKEKFEKDLEQKLLNLQLMYFREYIDKYGRKDFFKFISEIFNNNISYYNDILSKNILSRKWKIFIVLLKNKYANLLYLYIKLYEKLKVK